MSLFEYTALLESTSPGASYIINAWPPGFDVSKDLYIITINAFPSLPKDTYTFYTFTSDDKFCHTFRFPYDDKEYAIVIVTKQVYHLIYIQFLMNIRDSLTTLDEMLSPDNLFTYINTMIASWQFIDDQNIDATFFEGSRIFNIERSLYNMTNFNPFCYLPEVDCTALWSAILTNKKVLIVADDPTLLCQATLAMTVFVQPFEYHEEILISLSSQDERIRENNAKIVGILRPKSLKGIENEYKIMVQVQNIRDGTDDLHYWVMRAEKLHAIMVHISTIKMIDDPFYLALNHNAFNESISNCITEETAAIIPPIPIILQFAKSKSMCKWQKQFQYGSDFRNSFISLDMERYYSSLTKEERSIILTELGKLRALYENDNHMRSVISRQRKYLLKLDET